jgi:hypothetical protein
LVLRQEAAPLDALSNNQYLVVQREAPHPGAMATSGISCYGGKASHLGAHDAGTAPFGALGGRLCFSVL